MNADEAGEPGARSSGSDALGSIDVCEWCKGTNDCACGICWHCHAQGFFWRDEAVQSRAPAPTITVRGVAYEILHPVDDNEGCWVYGEDAWAIKFGADCNNEPLLERNDDLAAALAHPDNGLFSDDAERAERSRRKSRRASLRRDLNRHA
jgi:hypothetical protein